MVHGIGAISPEAWARQSVDALADWWTRGGREMEAAKAGCQPNCTLAPGHRHLLLTHRGRTRQIDLEPLFWADKVQRPNAWRCARLVLQGGLLIGLVDLLAAAIGTFEQLDGGFDSYRAMTLTCWRFTALFMRALIAPVLTLLVAVAVLVNSRLRATVGDALAWSVDHDSHERVRREIMRSLEHRIHGPAVLIGHSQGGSILAELEPGLRAGNGEARLVTLGSGHGLLVAVKHLMPDWGLWKSALVWAALLAFAVLAIVVLSLSLVTSLSLAGSATIAPFKTGAAWWLMHSVPLSQTQALLAQETNALSHLKGSLAQPFYLPPLLIPTMIASTVVGVLIVTLAVKPAQLLREAVDSEAPGVDVVATHDLVAASMLQLAAPARRRRVSQCGSLLFDHSLYLRNGCSVLPLLAAQVEIAASLRDDVGISGKETPLERHHRAGLTLRSCTRPLLVATIVAAAGWFAPGHLPAVAWMAMAAFCAVVASSAVTRSSINWLRLASSAIGSDPTRAEALERERNSRANQWWAALLLIVGMPGIGAGVIVFTTPTLLGEIAKHSRVLVDLTAMAFALGIALAGLAWLTLFGARSSRWAAAGLLAFSILWFSRGTTWGVDWGVLTLIVAFCAHRRTRRIRERLARTQGGAGGLPPHDEEHAEHEQHQPGDPRPADRLLGDPQQSEAVDHDGRRELPGDDGGGQPAHAQSFHRQEGDGHIDRSQQPAHHPPPGNLADVAERAQAAFGQRGDRHQGDRADDERHRRRLQRADLAAESRVDRRLGADQAAGDRDDRDGDPAAHAGTPPGVP
jgi:hypothetical protein